MTFSPGTFVRARETRFIRLFKEDVTDRRKNVLPEDVVVDGLNKKIPLLIICDPGGSYLLVLAGSHLGYIAKTMISHAI